MPVSSLYGTSRQQVNGTVNWRGTTLITFDMDVTSVIFDRNSVVYIQMYLLDQFREFLTSLKVFFRGFPLGWRVPLVNRVLYINYLLWLLSYVTKYIPYILCLKPCTCSNYVKECPWWHLVDENHWLLPISQSNAIVWSSLLWRGNIFLMVCHSWTRYEAVK